MRMLIEILVITEQMRSPIRTLTEILVIMC